MHNIIFIGPQGSGKGTQAQLLADLLNIPHISTGDLFRDAIAKESDLGKLAKKYINNGNLVPSDITIKLMEERLKKPDCELGFILDGFPRTLDQAHALEDLSEINYVFEINISDEESIKRISSRRICTRCNIIFGINKIPKTPNKCDKCNKPLIQREDDYPEAIKKRLETYHDLTEPLLEFYRPRNIVHKIDGMGLVKEVFERIKLVLNHS